MKFKPSNLKAYSFIIVSLLLIAFISASIFLREIQSFLLSEAESTLTDVSQQCAVAVKNKLSSRFEVLTSLANLDEISKKKLPVQDKLNLLRREVERSNFVRIGLSDLSGNAVTTDNQALFVADRDYFIKASQGLTTVSETLVDRLSVDESQSIIVYAVPVKNDEQKIIGILFATDLASQLSSVIQNIYVGPEKIALLLTSDGKILASSKAADLSKNFFELIGDASSPTELENLRKLLLSNVRGAGSYQLNDTKKIVGISNIENTNDWNIAVTAPQNIIMNQSDKIMIRVTGLIVVLLLFIFGSFIYFDRLNKQYLLEKQNAKLNETRLKIKDSFLANVSHEIRTPINAITGMTYFLKKTELTEPQNTYVKKIETASNVLLSIINDLLDISKISNDKLRLHVQPFFMPDVAESIDHIFSDRIREKGLRWKLICNDLPPVWTMGDKQRILQCLINLVNNAYKFTHRGIISLHILVASETEREIQFMFSVKDTGVGISDEDMQKLFIPFEQFEGALNKIHEGTGLGLCICQSLIHSMGGQLTVQSRKDFGSEFSFQITLPTTTPPENKQEDATFATNAPAANIAPILLVEDNDINAEIAGCLLEELACPYDWAKNGQIAVDMCREKTYSLILMDIHMPVMNGYESARILKDSLHVSCPIIALTATNVDPEARMREQDYLHDYILKPLNAEDFKQKITSYLTHRP